VAVVLTIIQALIGITLIASGLEGYLLGMGRIAPIMRLTLFVAGSLLAYPEWMTTVIGFCLVLVAILVLGLRRFGVSRASAG